MIPKFLSHWFGPAKSRKIQKSYFLKRFFSNPHHHWIVESIYLTRVLNDLFEKLPQDSLDFFKDKKDLIFLRSNGRFACSLKALDNAYIVLIFPDLYKKLMSAAPEYGLAILAHELGHLLCEHSNKTIDPIVAQVEADEYAFKLGYGPWLEDILIEQTESVESSVRLAYLTKQSLNEMK